tara:strand:+ start:475 stop:663 length:189 start_codon:yes stop_codon:yes gene_type:complete
MDVSRSDNRACREKKREREQRNAECEWKFAVLKKSNGREKRTSVKVEESNARRFNVLDIHVV